MSSGSDDALPSKANDEAHDVNEDLPPPIGNDDATSGDDDESEGDDDESEGDDEEEGDDDEEEEEEEEEEELYRGGDAVGEEDA